MSECIFFFKKIQILVVFKKLFKYEDTDILKLKEWRKIYYANTNQKKVEIATLETNQTSKQNKNIIRDKEVN